MRCRESRCPGCIDTGVVFVDRGNIDTYKTSMETDNSSKL